MSLVQRCARPLISSIFVTSGLHHLRDPASVTGLAEPLTSKLAGALPKVAKEPAAQVRINAAVQVGGGLLLSSRRWHRLAAAALIASLIPTSLAGHAFWTEDDAATRALERTQFQKNLAILGGLLLVLVDRGGKPSLGWWAKRRAAHAGAAVSASRIPLG